MKHKILLLIAGTFFITGTSILQCKSDVPKVDNNTRNGLEITMPTSGVEILYPYNETVFPPEIGPPTFRYSSEKTGIESWFIKIVPGIGAPVEAQTDASSWTPASDTWEFIKKNSMERPAVVYVIGLGRDTTMLARQSIRIHIAKDPVDAPIFYREVPLPFIDAVKDPRRIKWRFGTVDSPSPETVLENLPVCGNCHSFSKDGGVLGMDVDYANDKGSYVMTETGPEMVLAEQDVITWSDFQKNDKQPTFGLLSQVSPDGRYAVSTVKDRSVFVPRDDLAFSQLFFPLKGILAVYDRQTGKFAALPGADDPKYVHSNPTWSPDGKFIVFARAEAYNLKYLKDETTALLSPEECDEFLKGGKTFRFDLYRIPFNDGKGGIAEPIKGASENGKSNFFAKYSPDGKWIVFCQANSFMLLQPDAALYILPSDGGEAKKLACNRSPMSSWHSFSPNGHWLVFSSKVDGPYTRLLLSHIDENGDAAPPVVLSDFTAKDRAANIPEFVNLSKGGIARIHEAFVDDVSFMRTALENVKAGDTEAAAAFFRKALAKNPDNTEARAFLGGLLSDAGKFKEAEEHLQKAVALSPKDAAAHYNLGNALFGEGRSEAAIEQWREAARLDPTDTRALNNMGAVWLSLGRTKEAKAALQKALETNPSHAEAHRNLGNVLAVEGNIKEAVQHWEETLRLEPDNIEATHQLIAYYEQSGDPKRADTLRKQLWKKKTDRQKKP